MNISKELFLQMRDVAIATCNNSYLLNDGKILTTQEYKKLSFVEKLEKVTIIYKYATSQIIKI